MWQENFRNPIFTMSRLTPALVSVGPCGPLGDLSGNLSSQVGRRRGAFGHWAGINVTLPVLPPTREKNKSSPAVETSQEDAPSSRLFASIIQPPHATLFWGPTAMVLQIIILVSNNGGVEGRFLRIEAETRSHLPRYPIQNICLPRISRKMYSLQTNVYRLIRFIFDNIISKFQQQFRLNFNKESWIPSKTSASLKFPEKCTVLRQKFTDLS